MQAQDPAGAGPVIRILRRATRDLHERIEARFDAVGELADPARRPAAIGRYAALYGAARDGLSGLAGFRELDLPRRSLAVPQSPAPEGKAKAGPAFPAPKNHAEALGLLYVVEGSRLGGRIILRRLKSLGAEVGELSFLDPYGAETGSMWKSLVSVIEREGARGPDHLESICRGALRGFAFAERVLCGDAVEPA